MCRYLNTVYKCKHVIRKTTEQTATDEWATNSLNVYVFKVCEKCSFAFPVKVPNNNSYLLFREKNKIHVCVCVCFKTKLYRSKQPQNSLILCITI